MFLLFQFFGDCNLIVHGTGTGILNLPYGFSSGGLVLGSITLAVVFVLSFLTLLWLLDIMARAEGYNISYSSARTTLLLHFLHLFLQFVHVVLLQEHSVLVSE